MALIEKLYGVVIWYHPTSEMVANIKSYLHALHLLIIIDNSDTSHESLLADLDQTKLIYTPNFSNIGVASALNQGCKIALQHGAHWVLTMDQDSAFNDNQLSDFIIKANQYKGIDNVAIFTPTYIDTRYDQQVAPSENEYSKIDYTMTSGNIVALPLIQQLGWYLDELFIDWVDEEMCLRINASGHEIVRVNNALMNHFVGNGFGTVKLFGKLKSFEDYSPIRYYYITRNVFILSKMYPSDAARMKKRWKRLATRVVKYDNRNKFEKLQFILRGIVDFYQEKSGKYVSKHTKN